MEMKTVVLIFPKIESFKLEKAESNFAIPLSLLAIASKLVKKYKVEIIDARVEEDYLILINKAIRKNPVCIGISCMTGNQIINAMKIAREIKNKSPTIPIVWGGWHPSVVPEETLENELVDIIVTGQGEIPFYELVEALSKKKDLINIKGIYFKKKGKVIKTEPTQLEDINKFPPMPYELLDIKKYQNRFKRINYISSHGCPHRCGFCANAAVLKRRWSGLDAKRVVNELEYLIKKYGFKNVMFDDDNFFVDINRVRNICLEILKRKLKFTWIALTRAAYISNADGKFLHLIKQAGCERLLIGTETGSQQVLDYITKDTKITDIYSFIDKCKKYDIVGWHSIIVGFPNEPGGVLEKTFELIKYIKLANRKNEVMVFYYTPFPGTALFNDCIKLGFNPPSSLEGWSKYNISNITMPWITNNYRRRVSNFLYYVNLAYPDSELERRITNSHYKKLAYIFMKAISQGRLKLDFYSLPIEIYIHKFVKAINSNYFRH